MLSNRHQIKKILAKYPVRFAYIFGSQAKGTTAPFSDLDLAVSFDPNLDKKAQNETTGEIREELEKKLSMPEKIDIVCLNQELPFVLLRDIVYEGELIYSKNEQRRIGWEARALGLWLDWQYYQRQYDEAILNTSRV